MNTPSKKEIFFHVGIAKTGTTFLQYRVFPKLKGIYYIQRTRYKNAKKIIRKKKYNKFLVSREFDFHFEKEVSSFASSFPDARPIIVFRRHDSYIASQYRRFIKNGFTGSLTDLFDLDNDTKLFQKKYLEFYNQIRFLEKCYTQKPLVLIYEEFRNDPVAFVEKLAQELNVSIDIRKVDFTRKHSSYSEKQLKAIMALGKYINMEKRRIFKNEILHLLWRLYLGFIRYSTLYIAKFLPGSFFSDKPLMEKSELEKVREYFEKDWEDCLNYARNQAEEPV